MKDIIKKIDKILKSYYISIVSIILVVFSFIWIIVIWKEGNKKEKYIVDKFTYIKDRIHIDKIHTETDRYSKITTFYTEIISKHCNRYRAKYNKPNKWEYQGLNDRQLADIINLWYKGSRSTGIGYMILPAIMVRESSGNPLARTLNKDGSILEAGLYNNRSDAVNQALRYYNNMPKYLQNMFTFYFTKMEDLFDPINATKIEFCLVWGEKVYYKSDPTWYLTSVHWGNWRIAKLYHNGILPPKDYEFNIGTVDEDVRNPFVYYFIINQYISAFEHFTTKVRLEPRYDTVYKATCSKYEKEYINTYKYFNDFVELYDEVKKDKKEYYKEREKKILKLENKIRGLNAHYIESKKIIKTGRFDNIKDFYKILKIDLRKMITDLNKEKNKSTRIKIKITIIIICIAFICLLVILIFFTVKYFLLKRKISA